MLFVQILVFIVSLFLLYRGAQFVVDYASKIAAQFGVTPLVIALTIVAFGTSAPELVASIAAALEGSPDLITGNNVGSNIANIGLIMGIGAFIRSIKVHSNTLKREVPFFVAAAILVLLFSLDGVIGRAEGLVFIALAIGFTIFLLHHARKERVFDEAIAEVKAAMEPRKPAFNILMVSLGMGMLVIGAKFLIGSAVFLASQLGVSQAVIGITVIAIGTSLPELVTALVASLKRDNELVIGNVVGSNILNIFLILGVTALFIPITVSETILQIDIPIMIAFTLTLVFFLRTKYTVTRFEGLFLLAAYTTYILFVINR